MQIIFLSGTKCLLLPQYVNKFLVLRKKIEPAQNILGPLKGQGITLFIHVDLFGGKVLILAVSCRILKLKMWPKIQFPFQIQIAQGVWNFIILIEESLETQ